VRFRQLFPLPPLPRCSELARPYAPPFALGFRLRLGISTIGVARPGQRPAVAQEPFVDFDALDMAPGDQAPIAVPIVASAIDRVASSEKRKPVACPREAGTHGHDATCPAPLDRVTRITARRR